MAKSGRYSADRKKVATLTNAATTNGTLAQCGTVFIATGASGTTTYVLPAIAVAGSTISVTDGSPPPVFSFLSSKLTVGATHSPFAFLTY